MLKDIDINNLKTLYKDCINTSNLWHNNDLLDIQQLTLAPRKHSFSSLINQRLRLGKLVELFICYCLESNNHIKILDRNVQIKNDKITIGELDCLLLQNDNPIHLEIVYKFYVYDASVGNSELDYWIGPNRKDSLIQKLDKLKEKQLPLLYSQHTKPLLDEHQLKAKTIKQMVCFKAQLFIPFKGETISFKLLNKECVKGFYLKKNQLEQFAVCAFYIPIKREWILDVTTHAPWVSYSEFTDAVHILLEKKQSPLCWIKHPNETLSKCFIVWW